MINWPEEIECLLGLSYQHLSYTAGSVLGSAAAGPPSNRIDRRDDIPLTPALARGHCPHRRPHPQRNDDWRGGDRQGREARDYRDHPAAGDRGRVPSLVMCFVGFGRIFIPRVVSHGMGEVARAGCHFDGEVAVPAFAAVVGQSGEGEGGAIRTLACVHAGGNESDPLLSDKVGGLCHGEPGGIGGEKGWRQVCKTGDAAGIRRDR